jgi:adenine-specific DNA-methyltransferase
MAKGKRPKKSTGTRQSTESQTTEPYVHPTADMAGRPEVGTQASFKKKKPPKTYSYDSSLDPQLVWAGKAERLSFDVPTLPLFVHERLSTAAIIETLSGHKKNQQIDLDLFGDPKRSITDQTLRAYEYRDEWVNRMILGDSLVVMNSLLEYEGMGGQVQVVYFDPPYGVSYGSNFQPFVRRRSVKDNDDADMTREPEMVQAYRDTWDLGVHSYLSYLRDRLLLARELLNSSGSVFVQISEENLHHVRELLDEVFGSSNFVAQINFKTMMPLESGEIESVVDYVCWYARDKDSLKYRNLYSRKNVGIGSEFVFADDDNSGHRRLTAAEMESFSDTAGAFRVFKRSDLASSGYTPSCTFPIDFQGRRFETKRGKSWRTTKEGVAKLIAKDRLFVLGDKIYYKMYLRDFGYRSLDNQWTDTIENSGRLYVVQTTASVIERCILMTTDPGDLVLDPTCGSGTTAFVAERWGRRWITMDTSRVPLALARQRLLTANFDWYELTDSARGPAGGFVYKRKQNTKGEEVGGIVPHVTLRAIANDEPADEEVLVDRPEIDKTVLRVTGPFCFEATIPTPVDFDGDGIDDGGVSAEAFSSYLDRMLEVLRRSPNLRLEGNKSVTLQNIRPPARALTIAAEASVGSNGNAKPVAIVFGPENGAISERLVYEAAREAYAKQYSHLYVVGFGIEPNARQMVENSAKVAEVPATYVQASADLMMGDLLKNMRSSQIFSVCGLPDVAATKIAKKDKNDPERYQVQLRGVDTFDPVSMDTTSLAEGDIPAWFLDSEYNGRCFRVTQAFFPKTEAWESLRKSLKADFDDSVWDHLRGTTSAPFEANSDTQIAVKVIDQRGNELMVVKTIAELLKA